MNKITGNTLRVSDGRVDAKGCALPDGLRRRKLALGLSLALGSLPFAGMASAAVAPGGISAGTTPVGGVVVGGAGTITQNGVNTVINQQSTLLALNWQSFNLGKDASVLFNQPSFNAVALNRILDQNPSQIFGHINSNGQVFLINTHGIIFGSSAQLNVGGLVASTLDLTPTDFLSNHFNLDAHGGSAGIVNHGTIQAASGGSVSLVGGKVENDGLIVANYGRINLDGADKAVLDFDGNGLISVQITGALQQRLDADEAAVANKGSLQADSGTVVLEASAAKNLFTNLVNNTGVIDAHGISTDGGVVRLVGTGGNTVSSGSIDVSGEHGGSVQLLSDQDVGVMGGSIDASGTRGGGSIRVGGGWQGGEGLQTATVSYVGPDARLDADATQSGNGGSVVVWGNQGNNFYGSISARGGAIAGDGGRVETSAHNGLNVQGQVDASAPGGKAGTWLLDPYDVTIATGGAAFSNPFTAAATSTIDPANIDAALKNSTNVFVFTNTKANGTTDTGNITVNSPITAAGAGSLYLQAVGSIFLNANIGSDGTHPLNVNLWANYGGAAQATSYISNAACATCQVVIGDTASASITTSGGSVNVQTGDGTHSGGSLQLGTSGTVTGSIDTSGTSNGALNVIATGIAQQASGASTIKAGSASLDAGAGAITLSNSGNDFTGAVGLKNSGANDVTLSNGGNALVLGTSSVGSGALTVTGVGISQTGAITQASGAGAATFNAGAGAITLGSANDFTGAVSLSNSGANAVALSNGGNALALGLVNVGSTLGLTYGGSLTLNDSITLVGPLSFSTPVLLGNDITLTSGNGNVSFGGTVDNATGTARALTVKAGTGTVSFGGAVGGGINGALASLGSTGTGAVTLGGNVTTTGAQNYAGAVLLGGNTTLQTTNSNVGFGSTVDNATGTAEALTINAGTGAVTFGGAVGAGGNGAIGALTVNGGGATSLGAVKAASLATNTGTTTLNGNVTTIAGQTYNGAVLLGSGVALNTSNNAVDFKGAVDNAASGTPEALTVNAGTGAVTFAGGVGAGANGAIGALTVNGSGATSLGAVNAASLATNTGTTTLNGNVTTTAGQTYNGAVLLGGGVVLNTTNNAVDFKSTVDNAASGTPEALTVNAGTGAVTFTSGVGTGANGAIGALIVSGSGPTSLGAVKAASLATNTGTTTLNGNVTTTAGQTYNGAVTLGTSATLASTGGGAIGFGSTVDGGFGLTVSTSGTTRFGSAVGGLTTLTSLSSVGSGAVVLDGNVTTSGVQGYTGAVTLGNSIALSSSNAGVGFTGTVDNASATQETLIVNAANGLVSFGGTVGGGANGALSGLTTSSKTFSANALNIGGGGLSVTTTGGGIGQGGAFIVGGTSTFSASGALTLNNSNNDFTGTVTATGTGVSIFGKNTLGIASVTDNGNGDVSLTAGGTLTLSGNPINAGTGALTLASNGGTLATSGALSGGIVSLTGSGGITLAGNVTASNTLQLTSTNTPISQTAGILTVSNTTSVGAGSGAITLNGLNAFTGAVSLIGGTTQITNNGPLTLGSLNTGALTATSGGALNLGQGTVTGDLNATSNGTMSESGALTVTGNATFTQNGTSADILLGTQANDFRQGVSFAVGPGIGAGINNLSLKNTAAAPGPLTLPASVAGNLTLDYTAAALALSSLPTIGGNLDVTAGGAGITLNGSVTTGGSQTYHSAVLLGSGITLATTNSNVSFDGTVNNATSGTPEALAVNAGSGAVTFAGAVGAGGNGPLASLTTSSGTFNANALDIGAGGLSITTTAGDITQGTGVFTVAGTSNFSAVGHAINLTNNNSFGQAVTAIGTGVAITAAGNLMITSLTDGANGAVSLIAGGNLVTPVGNIDTGTSDLTLSSGNTLTTNGSLTGANVVLTGTNGLILQNNVTATLTVPGTGTLALHSSNGSITQSGGILTAATLTGNSNGSTTLAGLNAIASLGAFSANGFSLTDAQALTVNGAVAGGTGATTLTTSAGNNLTLAASGSVAGTGVTLTSGGALDAAAGSSVNSSNGALTLNGGALTLDGALNAGTGTASLNATGAITQAVATGVITAGTLTGHSTGSTSLLGANKIGSLGAFNATNGFSLTDAQALTVNGAVAGGTGATTLTTSAGNNLTLAASDSVAGTGVTLGSGGALDAAAGSSVNSNNGALTLNGGAFTLDGALNAGTGTASLNATGAITQAAATGVITAGTLTGHSTGSTGLLGANKIGSLGAFNATNGFSLTDAQALTVNGAVAGGTGATTLTTSAGNNLTLAASDSVAGTGVTLGSGGALDAAAGSSVNSNNGALTLNGGAFTLDGALNAGTGTASLNATGAITQAAATGVITAGTLTGHSTGSTGLLGANKIGSLGAFNATNGFSLTDAQALTVNGAVAGGTGATTLTTSAGNNLTLAASGNVAGTGVTLTSGGALDAAAGSSVNSNNGALTLNGGTLTLDGALNAGTGTASLNATGAITQAAATGVITAGTLTGHSTGSTSLLGANKVGTLGAFTTGGDFAFNDAQSLTINTAPSANGGAGNITLATTGAGSDLVLASDLTGNTVTLQVGRNLAQTAGVIKATTLTGSVAGSASLNGANLIGTLGSFSANGFSLVNAQALTVAGPLAGGGSAALATTSGGLSINGAVSGTTTTLTSAGAISEGAGGSITAGTLAGSSVGDTTLNGSGNRIGALGAFSATNFSLIDGQALTVGGPLNGGASITLATTSGDLSINGAASGATTTLTSAGAINEGSGGSITAATLTGNAVGAVALNGANKVGALGNFTASGFSLTNAQALTMAGTLAGGGSAALTTTSGGLSINGAVSGTTTTLTSAGAISEGASGSITAGTLAGSSVGDTTLNGSGNRIGALGAFSATNFSLIDGQALTVGGPLNGGASTTLTTTSGDLSINGAASGATTTLTSAGAINEGSGGSLAATTLTGRAVGTAALDGANRINTLGSFSANGFSLTNAQALTVGGPVSGGASTALSTTSGDLSINGAVNGGTTTLVSAGAISEGASGSVTANVLTGSSVGSTVLDPVNYVGTLGSFTAAGFNLLNGQALTVTGPVNGGASTTLTTTSGDISINGAVSGGLTTLVSAGALNEAAGGSITAATLTGSAAGPTTLGTATQFMGNHVGTLGGFSSPTGFSFTNAQTLTLASVGGSTYTVNAGTAPLYLGVSGGDLLQSGTTWAYDGGGTWSSTGRIGTLAAPIYVTGVSDQVVSLVGLPPAYFYAVDAQGNLLAVVGAPSVNVPTSALTSRAQNGNNHGDAYIDPSVINANYRSFGIVPSGILLPPDQQNCQPGQPGSADCPDND